MKHLLRHTTIISLTWAFVWLALSPVKAQTPTPPSNIPNPEDTLADPPLPEDTPPLPPEEQPEFRLEGEPQQPSPQLPTTPQGESFQIDSIELLGSILDPSIFRQLTVTVDEQPITVGQQIDALEGKQATLEALFNLRSFITAAYIEAGYITSGAFIPVDQPAFSDGGTVQIQLVEGDLEALVIEGLTRLNRSYVRDRIQLRVDRPINQKDIEEALRLLQLDPLIERVDAKLLEGSGPGLSILSLDVQESPPLTAGLTVNNYNSPSTSSEQVSPFLSYTNLFGLGDRLDLNYGLTEGLNTYGLNYTVPINPKDGTINFRASTNNSRIIEDNFDILGIRSNSRTFSLGVRQPLVRNPNSEFALGLSFDLRRSQTFILDDIPFSFSAGPEDGESKVSVIRFSQDWTDRSQSRVLAARSQFSFGIDAFDATTNNTGADGQFFSWLGQFQWVQQLPQDQLLVTRLAAQFTPDSLLSLEQFSLGGVRTVRGYRENQLVTDNGITGSLELRLPLSAKPGELQLTPFLEGGLGWNNGAGSQGLASIGTGIAWQIHENLGVRLDYGYPLVDLNDDRDTLQEQGIYFSVDWILDE